MTGSKPDAEQLRDLVLEQLDGAFTVHGRDEGGFSLAHEGTTVRVSASAHQIAEYVSLIEEAACEVLGIDPAWRSAVSLAAVHILEEAAMAEPGMTVIIDGPVVRRDPPPGVTRGSRNR